MHLHVHHSGHYSSVSNHLSLQEPDIPTRNPVNPIWTGLLPT